MSFDLDLLQFSMTAFCGPGLSFLTGTGEGNLELLAVVPEQKVEVSGATVVPEQKVEDSGATLVPEQKVEVSGDTDREEKTSYYTECQKRKWRSVTGKRKPHTALRTRTESGGQCRSEARGQNWALCTQLTTGLPHWLSKHDA